MIKWLQWISIRLFGGFLWSASYKMYNRMEYMRPAGGFRDYTWNFHKKRTAERYSLTYDECDELLNHSHKHKPWEISWEGYGCYRCVGCGVHRGGL